ncbi:MAG: Uncharacterized protein CEN90_357 [Parcubacteria group bacterium Licking1014_17]|nr:MAG: Uncharacterized protein CEN90_357 [Parcubacteria group bacterium Licking1014_17]
MDFLRWRKSSPEKAYRRTPFHPQVLCGFCCIINPVEEKFESDIMMFDIIPTGEPMVVLASYVKEQEIEATKPEKREDKTNNKYKGAVKPGVSHASKHAMKQMVSEEFCQLINEPTADLSELIKYGGAVRIGKAVTDKELTGRQKARERIATVASLAAVAPAIPEAVATFPSRRTILPEPEYEPCLAWFKPSMARLGKLLQRKRETKTFVDNHPAVLIPKDRSALRYRLKILVPIAASLVLIGCLGYFGATRAIHGIVGKGLSAMNSFSQAKENLAAFDFKAAADNFAKAESELESASRTMNMFGASIISSLSAIPGVDKVVSARNLMEAGKNLSEAGKILSQSLDVLYTTNLLKIMTSPETSSANPPVKFINDLKNSLAEAAVDIENAKDLLAGVSASIIPESERETFIGFKDKLPEFSSYINNAVDYSNLALNFLGERGPVTYLMLMQNNSELRPTGGFPGSYALLTFDKGYLAFVKVDDIYNPDGQMKEKIIPPKQLQGITQTWAMRDVGWFADFSASAKKFAEYFEKEDGQKVSGVFAITPKLITDILKITGPIEMPDYNLTLTTDNFVAEVQDVVENKGNRDRPKQILKDLQPKLFEKFAGQGKEQWRDLMTAIIGDVQEKHALAYFKDASLQKAVEKLGAAGAIADSGGDYLQVNFTNIKGSKADAVTENSMKLDVSIVGNNALHMLSIYRQHNGGDKNHKFYNTENSSYVRVYVPRGSTLENIEGESIVSIKPLVKYAGKNFTVDPDLAALEATISQPIYGADVFEESGKTVFGFWMNILPKNTQGVRITYKVPLALAMKNANYNLLWQKQPGTNKDKINYSIEAPDDKIITSNDPLMRVKETIAFSSSDLETDRQFSVEFK